MINACCVFVFSFLVSFGCSIPLFENDREQKSIHLVDALVIGNYIHSNMILKVSVFSAWMIIVQIIGFESRNGHTGKNVHSAMHMID